MRWSVPLAAVLLALAPLLAGCMQSGSSDSTTPPHTFSTTTPPTSTSTTTTGAPIPPRIAVLEISGWVNGTGPWTPASIVCDTKASARVDLAGKKLHLPADADPGDQLRLVVFDRSQSQDNATDGEGCRVNVLAGFASGLRNYTWSIRTGSGWVAGDRTFKLEPGTSTLAVDNLLLPVGRPRTVHLDWEWDRPDGTTYHYNGTLRLTYHGEWPRAAVLRDFEPPEEIGVARDQAVWRPMEPISA